MPGWGFQSWRANGVERWAAVTHASRKDAARHLVRWLREVQEALAVLEAWWQRRPVVVDAERPEAGR